jgi:hypothetical protein
MTHVKSSLHSRTFNSTELHSIILMPQLLCSQFHILAGWRLETQLTQKIFCVLFTTTRHGPCRKHTLYCPGGAFTAPLHRNGSSSIVACVFVSVETCLLSPCPAMNVYSGSSSPAFWRHVTIFLIPEVFTLVFWDLELLSPEVCCLCLLTYMPNQFSSII